MADRIKKYPKFTNSAFWQRKMKTSFRNFDKNNNKVLNEEDFRLIAELMVAGHKLEGAPADELRGHVKSVWKTLISDIHGNGTNTKVTEEEFIKSAGDNATSGKLQNALVNLASVIVKTMDVDGDGLISRKEFAVFSDSFGTHQYHGDILFDIMDKDGDGKISNDEFLDSFYDFYLNEDTASPFKVFRGALIPLE